MTPVAAAAAFAIALLTATPAGAADSPSPAAYRQAVQQVYDLIRGAQPGDHAPADRALAVLRTNLGDGQPEIAADLSTSPPAYEDARARLRSLLVALDHRATTADPPLAQHRLHDVLSMSRYDPLHRPPSLIDRFVQWVRDRAGDLLRLLQGRGLPPISGWYLSVIGALVVVAIAIIVFRSTRGGWRDSVTASRLSGPRPPADYFAEADRLSAAGDRVGAIRALCAGVAATLAGARTWEGSPLTVREIFRKAPDPAHLNPLLRPFEAAVYGGRDVDEATYQRADEVAAAYRRPLAEAA